MSLTLAMIGTIAWSFPRVSGDEPYIVDCINNYT